MKKITLIAVLIFGSAFTASADVLALNPGSHIYLSGTSTLHPYASTSTLTQIVAVLAPGNVAESTAPARLVFVEIARRAPFQKFDVIIPVQGLKSGESGLDKNMYKALKIKHAPEIRFTLRHYETQAAGPDGLLPFNAPGQLSIAGVTKDIVLKGAATPSADSLVVEGQYELRMSDYGIKPPTMLMGAVKVGDPVVIHFHLIFDMQKGEPK
jgi:polyisoprenoid-binding protein YceI